jgi:hypothetical protein
MGDSAVSGNSSQSKSLMWMMLGFFAGIAVLIGGGFLLFNRVVRSVGLTAASNNQSTVHTATGSFRLQKQDQVGPGLPVYPHASLELPEASGTAAAFKEAEQGVNVVLYRTRDTRDSVDSWYSQHLSPEFTRHDVGTNPPPAIFKKSEVSGSDIVFVAERGLQKRMVALSMEENGTKISLIRVDKAPAPTNSGP